MTRRSATVVVAGMFALALAACASMFESPLDKTADQLKSALVGSPVNVTKQDGSIILTSSADYLYPSGGWQLPPQAPVLDKIASVLSKLQHTNIVVSGYTDNTPVGPQLKSMGISNNLDLSSKRAAAVVTYLTSHGVNPSLISSQGFGDANPIGSNDTPEGRARNRRVQITLTGDGT